MPASHASTLRWLEDHPGYPDIPRLGPDPAEPRMIVVSRASLGEPGWVRRLRAHPTLRPAPCLRGQHHILGGQDWLRVTVLPSLQGVTRT